VRKAIFKHLKELKGMSPERLFEQRYEKFRKMGVFAE
jgi:acetyl-CoA carboxylase carboxyl transferase subunit alpha